MEVKLEQRRLLNANYLQKLYHMVSKHPPCFSVQTYIFKLESWGDICNTCCSRYPGSEFQLLSLGDKEAQILIRWTLDTV
jgi:hypothetical protein